MTTPAEKFFKLRDRKTTLPREIAAGFTTFATMSYILAVNPAILGLAGMDKAALVTVTALATAFGCVVMALLTNMPIAVAPAMGSNTYFAVLVCVGMGMDWREALALVFYNGLFFLLISITGVREKIIAGVPRALQIGLQAGIGMFIAFFGLKSAGIIVGNPNTLVTAGDITSPECLFALCGIALVSILTCKKFRPAIISTIALMTLVAFFATDSQGRKMAQIPDAVFSLPHGISETFMQLDWTYPFRDFRRAMPVILMLLFLDLFDTIATVIALGRRSGMMSEDGHMKNIGRALVADATATIGGAMLGTSTTGAYVESAAGIEAGGRTGIVPLVVAALFLLSLFISPLINAIPAAATAPALVLVGIMMMQGLKDLKFDDLDEVIPTFFCMMIMALTFKISEGFAFGIIAYTLILVAKKRAREIRRTTWLIFVVMCLFVALS